MPTVESVVVLVAGADAGTNSAQAAPLATSRWFRSQLANFLVRWRMTAPKGSPGYSRLRRGVPIVQLGSRHLLSLFLIACLSVGNARADERSDLTASPVLQIGPGG